MFSPFSPRLNKYFNITLNCVCLFLFIVACTFNTKIEYVTDHVKVVYYYPYKVGDSWCYAVNKQNKLSAENREVGPRYNEKTIFFIETSCKGGLDPRQACAIESAARANPEWEVVVFFLGPIYEVFKKSRVYQKLGAISNVYFMTLQPSKLLQDINIAPHLPENFDVTSRPQFFASILRFMVLQKYSGVYLDTDMIVTNSFNDLPLDWVSKNSVNEIGVGALGMSSKAIGRNFANLIMQEIHRSFLLDNYYENRNDNTGARADKANTITIDTHSRPEVFVEGVLFKLCSTNNISSMSGKTCQGIQLLDSNKFYLINSTQSGYYNRGASQLALLDTFSTHAHKTWIEQTEHIRYKTNTKLGKLANKYCTEVHNLYKEEFGP